jgi:hypothetical protein
MAARSVCVFCGSKPGGDPTYADVARAAGTLIAERGWRLVYGGGGLGLMGETARACRAAGGRIIGIIPTFLMSRELGNQDVDELIVVDGMHERKSLMFARSDGFLVLPGGFGTLDETFEILTWRQIGLHDKPIVLLDHAGYWSPLVQLIDAMVIAGFVDRRHRALITVVPDLDAAAAALDQGPTEAMINPEMNRLI